MQVILVSPMSFSVTKIICYLNTQTHHLVRVKKKDAVWLKIPGSVSRNTAGNVI